MTKMERDTVISRSVRKRDHPLQQGLRKGSFVSTTVDPMRGERSRGQLWAFVYLAVAAASVAHTVLPLRTF